MNSTDTDVRIGFIPLTDAAPVIVAQELGFGKAEGLQIHLIKETSWATMRDRLAVGQFDAAHMLAPMPIASNLGLVPLSTPMVVPMALGTGANTISASVGFMVELEAAGHSPGQLDALSAI
ncbi:MAG: ABC transporter substrate-binding protein, partial [Pseudomonadota bacterium]